MGERKNRSPQWIQIASWELKSFGYRVLKGDITKKLIWEIMGFGASQIERP